MRGKFQLKLLYLVSIQWASNDDKWGSFNKILSCSTTPDSLSSNSLQDQHQPEKNIFSLHAEIIWDVLGQQNWDKISLSTEKLDVPTFQIKLQKFTFPSCKYLYKYEGSFSPMGTNLLPSYHSRRHSPIRLFICNMIFSCVRSSVWHWPYLELISGHWWPVSPWWQPGHVVTTPLSSPYDKLIRTIHI